MRQQAGIRMPAYLIWTALGSNLSARPGINPKTIEWPSLLLLPLRLLYSRDELFHLADGFLGDLELFELIVPKR